MGKYEYIGKREILRRVRALGYFVRFARDCSYKKFEGVEWVESAKIKITAQRGGDWIQITQRPENITHTYSRYDGKSYLDKW
jgi:hypothetical protein